ncbi:MAG: PAS domain S-box protein [Methanoregulaceae archaeon]
MRGGVDSRKVGTAKIFYAAERAHAISLLRFSNLPILILNSVYEVEDMNNAFSQRFRINRNHAIGKTIEQVQIPFFTGYDRERMLKSALRGNEQRIDFRLSPGKNSPDETLSLVPVVLNNGKPGIAFVIGAGGSVAREPDPYKDSGLSGTAFLDDEMEYIIRTTRDGTITQVNETYCSAVGKTKTDLQGTAFRPLILLDDTDRVASDIQKLTPKDPVTTIEYRAVMEEGSVEWQRWRVRLLVNDRNEPDGYQYIGMNITDFHEAQVKLERAEKALEESVQSGLSELREINRQLYQEIANRERIETQLHNTQFAMDNAVDMVLWINRNARIFYGNLAAEELLGYQNKNLYSLSFGDIFPLYHLSKWDEVWIQLKEESTIHAETSIITSTEDRVPVDVVFRYLEYKGKEFACCFVRDITARKQTELALRESEALFRTLAESAPVGIALLVPPGKVEYVNPKLIDKLGYSLDELRDGKKLILMAFPDPAYQEEITHKWHESLEKARNPGSTFDLNLNIRAKDGSVKTLSIRGARLPNQNLLVHCNDITEQVRMEAALMAANRKLNLLSSITRHDVLNKITVLLGILGRMKRSSTDSDLLASYGKLENAVKFIRGRIEYTKDYKNLGAEPPAWQNIREVCSAFTQSAILGNVRLTLELPEYEIYADLLFPRVIEKLLEHSVKYGDQVTRIRISFGSRNSGGVLLIEDNGVGIRNEDKEILFNPANDENMIGSLQIVREILSVTGLQITESGTYGKGARFEIFIPKESLHRAS